jgi:hypothetical protein
MNIASNSSKLGKLSSSAVTLLKDIKALDQAYLDIQEEAASLNISITAQGPNDYLAALAVVAKQREQEALSRDAVARTEAQVQGSQPVPEGEPRSKVGRWFMKAAQAIG